MTARNGAFVVVVGPDGVGKTTAASNLLERFDGPTGYFHFRPPMKRPLLSQPPEHSAPPLTKGSPSGPVVLGWVRLARNYLRFWIGYLIAVRPLVQRGGLVIGDRWAYGYLVHPYALKYYGPEWLAKLALRTMPRPGFVINLTAPADVIFARKQELSLKEIEEELDRWRQVPASAIKMFDATQPPGALATTIAKALRI